ncbi:hypothetical protein R3W88_006837 [Solanum pinnatisectum]|uniref:Uncharacterized protein n=1 Tax=Solanum pinnatisectum TaxID=50273 RepID=A0AAV9KIC1_9SOLN|nr:hypothetical protein R3W88_006837 [Solanum pinnatisectum]
MSMSSSMMMMKPSHNATSTLLVDSGITRWNSPVPYLFGGIALILGLIALALLVVTCSYKKPSTEESSSRSNNVNNTDHGQEKKVVELMKPEMEPKFVVIMPGDYNPTWLAKPTLPIRYGPDQV